MQLNTTATSFKLFCLDNPALTMAEAKLQWDSILKTRQNSLKCQREYGKASGKLTYKQLGNVNKDGLVKIAEIALCTATVAQIEATRTKKTAAHEKLDAKLATLAEDAPAYDHFVKLAQEAEDVAWQAQVAAAKRATELTGAAA